MANKLPQIETDEIRHLTTESEAKIKLVTVKSDDARTLKAVDQGGVNYIEYDYTGSYEFTPTQSTQTAPTANKTLTGNITINPIPSNYGLITWDGATLTVS